MYQKKISFRKLIPPSGRRRPSRSVAAAHKLDAIQKSELEFSTFIMTLFLLLFFFSSIIPRPVWMARATSTEKHQSNAKKFNLNPKQAPPAHVISSSTNPSSRKRTGSHGSSPIMARLPWQRAVDNRSTSDQTMPRMVPIKHLTRAHLGSGEPLAQHAVISPGYRPSFNLRCFSPLALWAKKKKKREVLRFQCTCGRTRVCASTSSPRTRLGCALATLMSIVGPPPNPRIHPLVTSPHSRGAEQIKRVQPSA